MVDLFLQPTTTAVILHGLRLTPNHLGCLAHHLPLPSPEGYGPIPQSCTPPSAPPSSEGCGQVHSYSEEIGEEGGVTSVGDKESSGGPRKWEAQVVRHGKQATTFVVACFFPLLIPSPRWRPWPKPNNHGKWATTFVVAHFFPLLLPSPSECHPHLISPVRPQPCTSTTCPQRGGKYDAGVTNTTTTSNGPPRYVNSTRTWIPTPAYDKTEGPKEGESISAVSWTQQQPFKINRGK